CSPMFYWSGQIQESEQISDMLRSKKTRVWLIFLVLLHLVVLAAGFVAPYDPIQQDRSRPFAPPMRIHLVDTGGKFHLLLFAYAQKVREGSFDQYDEDPSAPVHLRFLVAGTPYHLFGVIPARLHLFGAQGFQINLFGTDGYGRDLFSRIF